MDPEGRPPLATSVPAKARTHRLARLIGLVLAAFVLVEGLLLGLGLLVTRVLDDSSLPRQEIEFEQTIVTERTPLFDQVTRYGSAVGATVTVIVLTAVGCLLLAWRGRGPRLPVFLAVAVARHRPADLELPVRAHGGDHRPDLRARARPGADPNRPSARDPDLVPGGAAAGGRSGQQALPGDALADGRRRQCGVRAGLDGPAARDPAAARCPRPEDVGTAGLVLGGGSRER
jgi:hypothetical protein